MPRWTKPFITALFVICASLYLYLTRSGSGDYAQEGSPAPAINLTDITGQNASLAHYKGKVVLLDFWATWCDGCREEIPLLKKINAMFQSKGFALLAASVDDEGPKVLIPFSIQNKLPWRILIADAAAVKVYRVTGIPTKYLIDRNGVIVRKYSGNIGRTVLENDIAELINKRRNS